MKKSAGLSAHKIQHTRHGGNTTPIQHDDSYIGLYLCHSQVSPYQLFGDRLGFYRLLFRSVTNIII